MSVKVGEESVRLVVLKIPFFVAIQAVSESVLRISIEYIGPFENCTVENVMPLSELL